MDDQLLARENTSRYIRLACTWSAVPMVVLLFGGLIYSGFMVPILPSATAEQVAAQYRTDTSQIRLGLAVSFVAVIFLLAFGGGIADQTRRIRSAPAVLTYIQIASVGAGSLIFVIPWVCWETAAFRPEREATQIMLLNDLGWIAFVFSYVAFTAWLVAIGVAILVDVAPTPAYPRWLGYFNIVVAVIFVPDNVIPFFKTGPFGWNGIFPYWIPFVSYGIWILLMLRYTVAAINAEVDGQPRNPAKAAATSVPVR